MLRAITITFIASILGACAGLTKKQCENIDSFQLGRIDGSHGRQKSHFKKHLKSCEGTSAKLEEKEYLTGRELGVFFYCTTDTAYAKGRDGTPFYDYTLCQSEKKNELLKAYKNGRKVFMLSVRKSKIEEDAKKKSDEFYGDQSVVGHISQTYYKLSGKSPTEDLDKEQSKLEDEIYEIESQSPVSTSAINSDLTKKIGLIKSAGSILAGATVGFGVGHAIQGRYKSDGWKWTALEASSIGVAIASTQAFCQPSTRPDAREGESECSNALPLLSVLSLLVFRVWQTVDLFNNTGVPEYESLGLNRSSDKSVGWGVGLRQDGWPMIVGTF